MIGKVKEYNQTKGYGKIVGEDQQEYFVHFTQIISEGYMLLNIDDQVTFDSINSNKGLQAHNVCKIRL